MCRAHQSRPGPSTDQKHCAFPHGKVCSGCAASLPPPLCTAVRRLARRDPPTAAVAADARRSVSPLHWSRPVPRSGRSGAALQRRSTCGDRTAPALSRSTTHTYTAADRRHGALHGPSRRALHRRRAAAKLSALLTRVGPGHGLVGPVPLCGGRERAAVVEHDTYRWLLYPRTARTGWPREGRSGRRRAVVTAREGRPTASPGAGLPQPVQPAGPGPLGMAVRGLQAYSTARRKKVFKGERLRSLCICNKP